MIKQLQRLAILLVLIMLVLAPAAFASDYEPEEPGHGDPIRLDGSMVVPYGEPGQTVSVVIPLYFSLEFGWNSVRDITITPNISTDPAVWPFNITQTSYLQQVSLSQRKARPTFSFTISQEAKAGVYPINFTLTYVAANGSTRETKTNTISTYVRVLSDGLQVKDNEQSRGLIVLSEAKTPSAEYSQRVTMELPLLNTGSALTEVSIKPVITTDLDTFPFVVESQSYEQYIGGFPGGVTRSVSYDFMLSEYVTTGAKAIQFEVYYTQNGVKNTGLVTAYVDVSKAKETDEDDEDKQPKPKLIVSAYNIEPEKVYAGSSFTLDVSFTNTSETAIQNITIIISNADEENAYVVPAKNGSNTIYVRRMEAGEVISRSLEMQVRPDTPAKPNMMSVEMDYENEKGVSYTAPLVNITVPINQEVRVVVEDPRFDNPFMERGMTAYPYFSILNMGKSSIYNAMVAVEGPGLSLEQAHYAGTIQAGVQYAVDIGIIANEPGEINGEIVVTFEDEYGDTMEERKPFTLTVQEPMMPELGEGEFGPDMMDPGMMEGEGGATQINKWWLIGGGVLLVVAAVFIFRKQRAKKRLKELIEDDAA